MARQERNDVDYFPHSVNHGKKMFYIRQKHGNDGYVAWFMLLENLGKTNFHYIDLNDQMAMMYLSSEIMIQEDKLKRVIEDLVKLGEFDKILWEKESILFNEKFINNVSDAYRKRRNECVDRNSLLRLLLDKGRINETKLHSYKQNGHIKGGDNPHRIGEDSIEEKRVYFTQEIQDNKTSDKIDMYSLVVDFLFGKNELKRPLKKVLGIRDPLSYDQFCKLLDVCSQNNKTIRSLLLELENYKFKKDQYVSVYVTLLKWAKR